MGNWFETEKRKRNLADGLKETKGLIDGHCNRRACQRPLSGEAVRCSMSDHELFTDGRLYYCEACALLFDEADRHAALQDRAVGREPLPRRITREPRTSQAEA